MSAQPQISAEERAAIQRAAIAMGDMRLAMTRTQRIAYKLYLSVRAAVTIFVIDCSRRWGKTYFDAMTVHMEASKGPRRTIRYVAPTKLHGRQFVMPAFEWVFAQLPPESRPRFVAIDNTWIWPNRSVCHLGSAETMQDVEAQVGTECHLAIVDEAGKMRSELLEHLVLSVLLPQFLTTNGNILVTSTPALVAAHYLATLVLNAQRAGALASYTLDDCDHIPQAARTKLVLDALEVTEPEDRDAFAFAYEQCTSTHERIALIREFGGPNASVVLRELYCVRITERSRMVVPEWSDVAHLCVREQPVPDYCDWYTIADFGFNDLTVVGFLYLDFRRSKLVLHSELAFQGTAGTAVGYAIREKEEQLKIVRPKRFADGTPQLLADLAHETLGPGITFGPVMKDDSEAAMNALRMRISKYHIEIDPRCRTTIAHLENGTWNARRTDLERIRGFGHFDALDMLKYAVRSVDWKKNPFPVIMPDVHPSTHHIPGHITEQMRRSRAALRQAQR